MYAASFRPDEHIEEYLRASIARFMRDLPPNVGVFPIDLDCFASLTPAQLERLSRMASPYAAYVVHSLRWLAHPVELEALGPRQIASQLRLEDARRQRFGDPFLLLAYKAAEERQFACAWYLSGIAADFELVVAHQLWEQLYSMSTSPGNEGLMQSRCGEEF